MSTELRSWATFITMKVEKIAAASILLVSLFTAAATVYAFSITVTPNAVSNTTTSITVACDSDRWSCFAPDGSFKNQNTGCPSQSGAWSSNFCGGSTAEGTYHIVGMTYHGGATGACFGSPSVSTSNYNDCITNADGKGEYDGVQATLCYSTSGACGGSAPPDTIPVSPSAVGAVSSTTALRIDLSWTDNSSNEDHFAVERSTTSATAGFSFLKTVASTSVTTSDTSLSPNTTYYYRISAVNGAGTSTPIVVESGANGPTGDSTCAATYANPLTFSKTVSASSTLLVVHAFAGGITSVTYAGVSMTNAISTVQGTTWYLVNPTSGTHNVSISTSSGVPILASAVSFTGTNTTNPVGATATSSNLGATNNPSLSLTTSNDNSIIDDNVNYGYDQTFAANSPQVEQIQVHCGASAFESHGASTLQTTAHGSYTSSWTGSSNSWFQLAAEVNAGQSNVAFATSATIPADPSNLTLSRTYSGASSDITLSWSDNSSNELGFKVERRSGGGSFTQIATTSANATSYSDSGLTGGTYAYRVRAFNDVGSSAYSNTATSTPISIETGTNGPTSGSACSWAASLTFSKTVSATSTLLIVHGFSGAITGVTYAGVSMINAISSPQGTTWYLVNPTSGTHNVVINTSGFAAFLASAVSYAGTDTTNPIGTTATSSNQGATSTPSVDITTTNDNSIIDDNVNYGYDQAISPNSPQIEQSTVNCGASAFETHGASTLQTTAHGPYTSSWTGSSNSWYQLAAEVNAAQ